MNKFLSSVKSIFTCSRQKTTQKHAHQFGFSVEAINADEIPPGILQLLISGRSMQVVAIEVGSDGILFSPFQDEPIIDDKPPVRFVNNHYNVALQMSYADYKYDYKPFQDRMNSMARLAGLDIFNTIKAEKPAAIRVDAESGTFTLVEALTFSGESDTLLMPPCQLVDSIRSRHLFNATTSELLSGDEFRSLRATFEDDLEKQTAVKSGDVYLRTVPQALCN